MTAEFLKHTIDTLNVNQQLVQPVSSFDFYWKSVPEEEEGLPEMAVLNDVFEQLQAKGVEKVRPLLFVLEMASIQQVLTLGSR